MNKSIKISIGLLVFAVIGLISYLLIQEPSSIVTPSGSSGTENTAPLPSSTVSPPSPRSPKQVEGWKTYQNREYRFSFQFPPEWEITEAEDPAGTGRVSIVLKSPCIIGDVSDPDYFVCTSIEVIAAPKGNIGRNCPFLTELYTKRLSTENIFIGNIQTQKVIYEQPPDDTMYICIDTFTRNGSDFMFLGTFPEAENNPTENISQYRPVYDKIVSTFHFVTN